MEDLRESLSSDSRLRKDNRRLLPKPMEPNIWEDKFGSKLLNKEEPDHQEMPLANKDRLLTNLPPFSSETSASRATSTLLLTSSDNAEMSSPLELLRVKMEEAEDSDMSNSEEERKSRRLLSWLELILMEDKLRLMLLPQDKEVVDKEADSEETAEEELPEDSEDQEEEDPWEVEEEEFP